MILVKNTTNHEFGKEQATLNNVLALYRTHKKYIEKIQNQYKLKTEFLRNNAKRIVDYIQKYSKFMILRAVITTQLRRKNNTLVPTSMLQNLSSPGANKAIHRIKSREKLSWKKLYKEYIKKIKSPVIEYEDTFINNDKKCTVVIMDVKQPSSDIEDDTETTEITSKSDNDCFIESAICDEDTGIGSSDLSNEDVTSKLKEQLSILKSGKRNVSLLGDIDQTKKLRTSTGSLDGDKNEESNHPKEQTLKEGTPEVEQNESGVFSDKGSVEVSVDESTAGNEKEIVMKNGFLDSLISKLGNNLSEKSNVDVKKISLKVKPMAITIRRATVAGTPGEIFKKNSIKSKPEQDNTNGKQVQSPLKNTSLANKIAMLQKKIGSTKLLSPKQKGADNTCDTDSSSSSTDFRGFSESEILHSDIPGLLPTPHVQNNKTSAFISESLDNFFRENCLEDTAKIELPKNHIVDNGLVGCEIPPPEMKATVIMPTVKARTVAEKRQLLDKKGSMETYILEFENNIYREINNRRKTPNYVPTEFVKEFHDSLVPCQRSCWKATSWLCTKIGNYYFQTIKIDGCELRLCGSRGNHPNKLLNIQSSRPFEKYTADPCPAVCQKIRCNNKVRFCIPSVGGFYDRHSLALQRNLKPSPLSKKCLEKPQYSDANLGPLDVYRMPQIELELFPRVNKPLNDHVKPYLKMLTVSGNITKEFAQYAASVVVNRTQLRRGRHPTSFKFKIPYQNDQDSILVRKMFDRKEDHSQIVENNPLSFSQNIDENDKDTVDCANLISDMIDSVAIGLCEDSFVQDDPSIDYQKTEMPKEVVCEKPKQDKKDTVGKLRCELKRLNAQFVEAQTPICEEKTNCNESHCKLGCICHSLNLASVIQNHCKKVSCMFECNCEDKLRYMDPSDDILSNHNALLLREKSTAKLARVEKEFCSTVVLTNNKPLLLNDPHISRKRQTRIPKRYNDYVNEDLKPTEVNEKPENEEEEFKEETIKYKLDATAQINISKLYPIMRNSATDHYKHCLVKLHRLKGLDDIEPWCMVHCLYRCFCQGKATKGEPIRIEKPEVVENPVIYARKRRYSFDRGEEANTVETGKKQKEDESQKTPSTSIAKQTGQQVSRAERVQTAKYLKQNRARAVTVRKRIQKEETPKTQEILKKKINGSIFNGRKIRNSPQAQQTPPPAPDQTAEKPVVEKPRLAVKKFATIRPDPVSPVNSDAEKQSVATDHKLRKNTSLLLSEQPLQVKKIVLPIASLTQQTVVNKPSTMSRKSVEQISCTPTHELEERGEHQNTQQQHNNLPVISSVCSLKSARVINIHKGTCAAITNAQKNDSKFQNSGINGFINLDNLSSRITSEELFALSIQKLNSTVTNAMHSISYLQKQSSKMIPKPKPGVVYPLRWVDFVQAYNESLMHVWYVCTDNKNKLIATREKVIPRVVDAVSVSNIKAIDTDSLPLLGKLLKNGYAYSGVNRLSVILYGEQEFWRICGFIHSNIDYLTHGCVTRPTPESHPLLAGKINRLYKAYFSREYENHNGFRIQNSLPNNTLEKNETTGQQSQSQPQSQLQPQMQSQIKRLLEKNTVSPSSILRRSNEVTTYHVTKDNSNKSIKTHGNVEEREITDKEAKNLYIPMITEGESYWLLLKMENDFSQILISGLKTLLDFHQIQYAIKMAEKSNKVVEILRKGKEFGIYATPTNHNMIYIGPFKQRHPFHLVLLQKFNGKILRREDYEKAYKILRTNHTVMMWLNLKEDKLIRQSGQSVPHFPKPKTASNPKECIVIDDDDDDDKNAEQVEYNSAEIVNRLVESSIDTDDKQFDENNFNSDEHVENSVSGDDGIGSSVGSLIVSGNRRKSQFYMDNSSKNDNNEIPDKYLSVEYPICQISEPISADCSGKDGLEGENSEIMKDIEFAEVMMDKPESDNNVSSKRDEIQRTEEQQITSETDLELKIKTSVLKRRLSLDKTPELGEVSIKKSQSGLSLDLPNILKRINIGALPIITTQPNNNPKVPASNSILRKILPKPGTFKVKPKVIKISDSEITLLKILQNSKAEIAQSAKASKSAKSEEQNQKTTTRPAASPSQKCSLTTSTLNASEDSPVDSKSEASSPRVNSETFQIRTYVEKRNVKSSSGNSIPAKSVNNTNETSSKSANMMETRSRSSSETSKSVRNGVQPEEEMEEDDDDDETDISSFMVNKQSNHSEIKKPIPKPAIIRRLDKKPTNGTDVKCKDVNKSNGSESLIKPNYDQKCSSNVTRVYENASQITSRLTEAQRKVLAKLPKNLPKDLVITAEVPSESNSNSRWEEINKKKIIRTYSVKDNSVKSDERSSSADQLKRRRASSTFVDLTDNVDHEKSKLKEDNEIIKKISRQKLQKPNQESDKSPEQQKQQQHQQQKQRDPNRVINGYLISPFRTLGKIPAKKKLDSYLVKIPGHESQLIFKNMHDCERYILKYLRSNIKGFTPKNWYPSWFFITADAKVGNQYELHSPKMLHPNMVVSLGDIKNKVDDEEISKAEIQEKKLQASPEFLRPNLIISRKRKPEVEPSRPAGLIKRRHSVCAARANVLDPNIIQIDD